ncbi:electron transfer flavoprotein subunit beta/FixA family protein [Desulfocicer niacini]
MRIYVCVKHVPDTAANIKIVGDDAYDTQVKYVANPYDEYGVEEAVTLVAKAKEGEVVAVCVGNKGAANTLKSVMAMGAHRSILVKTDDQFPGSDLTAKALAKAITDDGNADLVFMGKQSVDSEGMQTSYRLGMALSLPVVTGVVSLAQEGDTINVQREIDGGARETLAVKTPCILGATKGLNEPRFPKLPDILKAKKKEIKEVDLQSMGFTDEGQCKLKSLEPVQERSNAKILQGSTQEIVSSLVKILREEEKVL